MRTSVETSSLINVSGKDMYYKYILGKMHENLGEMRIEFLKCEYFVGCLCHEFH